VTQDNERLVREWLAAGDRGETQLFHRFLHEDVVVHAPLGLSSVGIDAERAVWERVRAGVPDLRHDVKEVISSEDSVAVRSIASGTHLGEFLGLPPTGRTWAVDHATFAIIRSGKIAEVWEIADSGSLLDQLRGHGEKPD
jgi:steroid delta-isomerase-like uncharacterized protein